MVTIPGGTSDSIKDLKTDLEKKGGEYWIKYIPGDEGIEVRFLTEPEEWFKYREHYSDATGYFPCIGDGCPGCSSESKKVQRTSRRWLANAVDVDSGFVIPLKLPLELVNKLVQRYERHGDTIKSRNYKLFKYGSGLDTTYDVEAEGVSEFPFDQYERIDLYEVLADSFADAFGDDGDDDDTDDSPTLDLSKQKDDDVPSEPSTPAMDDDDEDEEYLTEDDLHRMTKEELLVIGDNLEIEVSMTMKKQEMIDTIMDEAV